MATGVAMYAAAALRFAAGRIRRRVTNQPVALFPTCVVDAVAPEVGFATARVLTRRGCDVSLAEATTCCGQPAWNAGQAEPRPRPSPAPRWPGFEAALARRSRGDRRPRRQLHHHDPRLLERTLRDRRRPRRRRPASPPSPRKSSNSPNSSPIPIFCGFRPTPRWNPQKVGRSACGTTRRVTCCGSWGCGMSRSRRCGRAGSRSTRGRSGVAGLAGCSA